MTRDHGLGVCGLHTPVTGNGRGISQLHLNLPLLQRLKAGISPRTPSQRWALILSSPDPHVQAARRILAAMEPGEAQTVLKFLSALPHPSSVLTPGPRSTRCVDQATQTETVRQSTAQVQTDMQTDGSESQPAVRSSAWEEPSPEEPIGLPLCSLHSAQATDMPIDAGELIEWSATSLILLPTIKNRLNTMLPELFRMLASLQELQAGDHIIAAREAQHYTALHSEFHQAPELAVGNWVLAMAGELIAPGLNQHFRADDTFGSFVEAWLVQLRRARDSPGSRASKMQRRFIRLASLLHDVVAPMQQSRQLYDLMSWRRGKAYNLRILLTVANWCPPELASPLLPERRVCSLEDEARQDPGTDSPGGTADAGSSPAGTTMMADIAQGTQDGVVVSTPSSALAQEPANAEKRACDCKSLFVSQPDYLEHDRLPTDLRSCPGKRGRRWRFRQSCPKKRQYRRKTGSPQHGLRSKLGVVLRRSLHWISQSTRHLLPQLRPCSKRKIFTPTFEDTTTSRARILHSLPGPKSGLRLALSICLHSIIPTGGVRVPIPAGMGGPNPNDHIRPHHVGKHAPGGTTAPVNMAAHAGATTGFKRSFRRAQHRCTQHNQGYTTYQGKLVHGRQLGLHAARTASQPAARKRRPECRRRGGHTQRLKILSINVNSLGGFLWSEVKVFLGEEGLQYDFIFLQETHRSTSSVFQIDKWMAVGSATKRGEGVLTLVNPKYDASMVRYQEIVPGRVLRVKVCRDDSALETLNVYQHVWIHTDEPEQNVHRRQLLLDKCTASIQGMARRDTLIVAGDFNSEVQHVPRLIGHSLNCSEYHKALDPHTLTRFVQHNDLVVLNTWRLKDPCTNYTRTGNSQIDFIMVRILSADAGAKRVHKCTAPFGTWKEMTHQALIADIRVIRHFHLPRPLHLTQANYAVKDLDRAYRMQDSTINALAHRVQHKLESIAVPTADQVNRILLQTVAETLSSPITRQNRS